jgi:hypothetical protein
MAVIRTSIDTRELRQLSVDLKRAPGRIQRQAPETMQKARVKLERSMKREASGHRYLPHLSSAISSEPRDSLGLSFEVGFEDARLQASIAHIIVFGSINNAPVYTFHGPLERMTPGLVERLGGDAEASVLGTDRAV